MMDNSEKELEFPWIDEENLMNQTKEKDKHIERLNVTIQHLETHNKHLTQAIHTMDGHIKHINTQMMAMEKKHIEHAKSLVLQFQMSRTWRMTEPFRMVSRFIKCIVH
ncbi:MAG: hypothetical protein ACHQAX_08060 [Gammaproteobacteria bacterium]